MELVKVDPKQYGLEETKAQEISNMFKPMLDKMVELEKEFNEVNKLEVNEENIKLFKALRLKYVKTRTATAKIHKDLKAFYLSGGRFVDGWKNAQLMASEGNEKVLLEKEKLLENKRKEEIRALQIERSQQLEKYECDPIPGNLGSMEDNIWENFLAGTKLNYDNRKEAEERALKEAEEARQAELNKNDAAKFKDMIEDLESIKTKYSFKSKINKSKYEDVGKLIDKIIDHIK